MDVDTFALMTPEKYNHGEDLSVQHKFMSKVFHVAKLFLSTVCICWYNNKSSRNVNRNLLCNGAKEHIGNECV
jgi:hypothetical protein